MRTLQSSRYPTILAAAIALAFLSGSASGQTADEAQKAEVAKQARTCENMLAIGHPALEDIDVLSRCSQGSVSPGGRPTSEGAARSLPDIDAQSALEKWRAKAAAYQDRKADGRPEPRSAGGYRDPVSRPLCDGKMTDNGCQQRRK